MEKCFRRESKMDLEEIRKEIPTADPTDGVQQ